MTLRAQGKCKVLKEKYKVNLRYETEKLNSVNWYKNIDLLPKCYFTILRSVWIGHSIKLSFSYSLTGQTKFHLTKEGSWHDLRVTGGHSVWWMWGWCLSVFTINKFFISCVTRPAESVTTSLSVGDSVSICSLIIFNNF
jgi:hypothetical protein